MAYMNMKEPLGYREVLAFGSTITDVVVMKLYQRLDEIGIIFTLTSLEIICHAIHTLDT